MRRGSARRRIELLAGSALALPRVRAVRPDLRRSALCGGLGQLPRSQAVLDAGWLAPGGWMSVETSARRRVDPGGPRWSRRRATSAAPGLRFCAALSCFAALRISSISLPSRRPIAAAAALPASLTALPARLPRAPSPPLVKPCSASAASAAVAATATRSATSGLCSSLMNASPIVSADRLPPLLRRSATACELDDLLVPLCCPPCLHSARRLLSHRDRSCGLGFARSTHATRVRIREWLDRLSLCSKRTRPRCFTATNTRPEKREIRRRGDRGSRRTASRFSPRSRKI